MYPRIRGTIDSITFYLTEVWRRKQDSEKKLGTKEQEQALQGYKYFARLYENAINPVDTPHVFTTNEMNALRIFGDSKCQNVPHLLSYWEGSMPEGVDEQAMPGGSLTIMLMNKLPGKPLDYDTFWNKKEETQEAIRCAFKVALM